MLFQKMQYKHFSVGCLKNGSRQVAVPLVNELK